MHNRSDWLCIGGNDPDEQPDAPNPPTDTIYLSNKYDVEQIWFTNDATNAYWRIDTYSNPSFIEGARVDICLDTDRDASTGYVGGTCNNIGTDRRVRAWNLNPVVVTVNSCTSSGCNTTLGSGTFASGTHIFEFQAPIATLGVTNGQVVSMTIYFDNSDSDATITFRIRWLIRSRLAAVRPAAVAAQLLSTCCLLVRRVAVQFLLIPTLLCRWWWLAL